MSVDTSSDGNTICTVNGVKLMQALRTVQQSTFTGSENHCPYLTGRRWSFSSTKMGDSSDHFRDSMHECGGWRRGLLRFAALGWFTVYFSYICPLKLEPF